MVLSVLSVAALFAMPALAQTSSAEEERRIRSASDLGAAVYAFDRAAWVATDALRAKLPGAQVQGIAGWVVEPAGEGATTVTFFRGQGLAATASFIAEVDKAGKLAGERVPEPATPLTEAQRRLATSRAIAAQEANTRKWTPCNASPFNTVVLPPTSDGAIRVYLLTPQVENGRWPLGGHYRVIIDRDGKVPTARPYSVACLDMAMPKLPAGAKPVALFVTHLLDPVPTEIHVFTSMTARMPLVVGTRDKRLWTVAGPRIIAQGPAK